MVRLIAVAALLVGGVASAAGATPVQEVTLRVERFYDSTFSRWRLTFSGTISSRKADEYVTVMARRCGHSVETAIAAGSTESDGTWEDTYLQFWNGGTATFRARWNGHVSAPVRLRGQLYPVFSRRPRGRILFFLTADSPLGDRFVELQRLAAGRWVRVRRARIAPSGVGSGTTYRATFIVRKRGLRLRFVVPAKTAGRCYAPAVTTSFVS